MNELENTCRFIGNFGKDPELQYLPSGTAKLQFSLAVDRRRKVGDNWENDTTWVDFTAIGKTAENIAKLGKKGAKFAVDAEYQKDRYTDKDGNNRVAHVFFVRNFKPLAGWQSNGGSSSRDASYDDGGYDDSGFGDGGEFPF